MRKRYLEWLKEASFGGLPPFSKNRAQERQDQIGTILDERYGYDVKDRFVTADNADSTNSRRRLSETGEYAARIKRLRGIINSDGANSETGELSPKGRSPEGGSSPSGGSRTRPWHAGR